MHQFQNRASGTQRPQPFDDAKLNPLLKRVRRCRKAIQHQNMVVFIQNDVRRCRHFLQMRRHGLFFAFSNANWRNADFIARFQLVFRFNAFCSPAPRLYVQDDKSYFWYPFSCVQKLSMRCPRFVSGEMANNFYGICFCYAGAILNSLWVFAPHIFYAYRDAYASG